MQGRSTAFAIGGLLAAALVVAPAAAALAQDAPEASAKEAPKPSSKDEPPGAAQADIQAPHQTEIVDGPALQIVFGERAVFHLDDKGAPVLDGVEKGKLAMAHPTGTVKETFAAPGPGKLAIAVDGSAEKQASYLKFWNGLDHPVIYHAGILGVVKGKLMPMNVKVCAAPARAANSQTWPLPVAAVAVANFSAAPDDKTCQ